jgi:hypothetical protein
VIDREHCEFPYCHLIKRSDRRIERRERTVGKPQMAQKVLERLCTGHTRLLGIVQSHRDFPSSSRKGWAFSEPVECRGAF